LASSSAVASLEVDQAAVEIALLAGKAALDTDDTAAQPYNGPRNLDSQTGKNKVLSNHAQTLQCDVQG
jgi:hypothetical protein